MHRRMEHVETRTSRRRQYATEISNAEARIMAVSCLRLRRVDIYYLITLDMVQHSSKHLPLVSQGPCLKGHSVSPSYYFRDLF